MPRVKVEYWPYIRATVVMSIIFGVHGSYYFIKHHASYEFQKKWGVEGWKEREAYYIDRCIVDRRRVALDLLRDDYQYERDSLKLIFEEFVIKNGPDTPLPGEFDN